MCELDKFERKKSGQGAVRPVKGFNLLVSNEDMDDTIIIVESLEKSGLLLGGATDSVKHETRKYQKTEFIQY